MNNTKGNYEFNNEIKADKDSLVKMKLIIKNDEIII